MSEKKTATQTHIIMSGKHSREENGERVSYRPGDLIELTQEEALIIRDKILTVAQFEAKVAAYESSEALEEKIEEILKPPEDPRDPEALERAEQIKSMKKPSRYSMGR